MQSDFPAPHQALPVPGKSLRILFYNWVDYLDPDGRGGGVSRYQRNLMVALEERQDVECVFLSSGLSQDLFLRQPRWSKVGSGPSERYRITNAAPLAPGHGSFGDPTQVSHPPTEAAFADFLAAKGPFDIVHFNNLEGLPAETLALKPGLGGTRFVLSLHNYYPFCPQVNLWHKERENCRSDKNGRNCVTCLPSQPNRRVLRLAYAVTDVMSRFGVGPGTLLHRWIFGAGTRLAGQAIRTARALRNAQARLIPVRSPRYSAGSHKQFRLRRQRFVDLINSHCDAVLGVSSRVSQIALRFGIDSHVLHTMYIGTDHASRFSKTTPRAQLTGDDGTMRLAYLGYMRRDKGFYFLLDALESLPEEVSRQLHLLIAARPRNPADIARVDALRPRLASIELYHGYEQNELDHILRAVDLGVIPALWEDNLPQVALELHARHIPLLTSDAGGAQELARNPSFVFRAGDKADFVRKLSALLSNPPDMFAYWAGARPPTTMADHVDQLLSLYSASSAATRRTSSRRDQ